MSNDTEFRDLAALTQGQGNSIFKYLTVGQEFKFPSSDQTMTKVTSRSYKAPDGKKYQTGVRTSVVIAEKVAATEAPKVDEFAERIDPSHFNFSPKLVAIVGAIIGHDYGARDGRGGRLYSLSITSDGYVTAGSTASDGGGAFIGSADALDRNLAEYRKELTAEDRAEFDRLYATRVTDWRS